LTVAAQRWTVIHVRIGRSAFVSKRPQENSLIPGRLLSLLAGLYLAGQTLFAQQLSISGTVQDSGGVIPDAQVTLRDPAGATVQTTTSGAGEFRFDGLRPGTYEVGIDHKGFIPQTRTLTLTNETTTADVTLQAAGGASTIDVNDVIGRATASGSDVPNREIPSYTVSVTEQELRDQGINDLPHALENVSGVMTQVQYGVYEWYTVGGITQQSGNDFLYVDGLRLTGNRTQTQLNNVEEVQVLKGPNSILYGGAGAGQGGIINIIRKKPSAIPANEIQYRMGRFGLEQVSGSSTGRIFKLDRLLYRADVSYSHADGWRQNSANRFTGAPELTWLINSKMTLTTIQTFTRDRYTLDAGIPAGLLAIPDFPFDRKLNPKGDFELSRDWQNEIDFRWNVTGRLTIGTTFFKRRNRDQYSDAETEAYIPASNIVNRSVLYFQHNRRPVQEITDVAGDYHFLGMRHRLLARYEYSDQYNYSNRTGNTPGSSNSNLLPLPPVPVSAFIAGTFVDTAPVYTNFPITRVDYSTNRFHTITLQDQVTPVKWLGLNFAINYPNFDRRTHNDNYDNGTFVSRGVETHLSNSDKVNSRLGAVFMPLESWSRWIRDSQFYFSHNTSFNPVTQVPADGSQLSPVINKSWEVGTRWRGLGNRLQWSMAARRIQDLNRVVTISTGVFEQVGKASTYNIDFDAKGDLGHGFRVTSNYAFPDSLIDRFRSDGVPQTNGGKRFPQAPKHISRTMATKTFKFGESTKLNFSLGGRYMRHYYTNTANTTLVPSVTTFDGAVSLERSKYDVQANFSNLLNAERYFVSVINGSQLYPGEPISATLTLRYRF
jgi:outer membrane receptor protein involved in Fe transport